MAAEHGLNDPLRDGEDIVQEVFAAAWSAWDKIESPKAWTYAVARRMTAEAARNQRLRAAPRTDADTRTPEQGWSTAAPRASVDDLAQFSMLVDALARLPRTQRTAVFTRHVGNWGTDEIAALLGCAAGTVFAHTHRGVRALRAALRGRLHAVNMGWALALSWLADGLRAVWRGLTGLCDASLNLAKDGAVLIRAALWSLVVAVVAWVTGWGYVVSAQRVAAAAQAVQSAREDLGWYLFAAVVAVAVLITIYLVCAGVCEAVSDGIARRWRRPYGHTRASRVGGRRAPAGTIAGRLMGIVAVSGTVWTGGSSYVAATQAVMMAGRADPVRLIWWALIAAGAVIAALVVLALCLNVADSTARRLRRALSRDDRIG